MDIIKKKATLWVTLALLGSSLEPIIVKICYQQGYLSSQLIILKLIVGGLFFLPFLKTLVKMDKKTILRSLIVSLLAIFTNYSVFLAVEKLPVSLVITLISTTPIFVGMIHSALAKVELGWQFWPSVLIVILGILLSFNSFDMSGVVTAVGLVFVAMAIVGSILYRVLVDDLGYIISPFQISTSIFLINGMIGLILLPFLPRPSLGILPYVGWLGVAGAVANIGFVYAIHILGATKTSVISLLQRPMVILLGAIMFKEDLGPVQVLGMLLVLLGVSFAKATKKERLNISKESV